MEKTRILIVDDNALLTMLVRKMLRGTGDYAVAVENRPNYALVKARIFKPAIVLLDINMPGKDGGEVVNELRADASLANVEIIFFTASISEDDFRARPLDPRERFLSKPADPATLLKTIKATMLSAAARGAHAVTKAEGI